MFHIWRSLTFSVVTIALGCLIFWKLEKAAFCHGVYLAQDRLGTGSRLRSVHCRNWSVFQPGLPAFIQNGRMEAYMTTVFLVFGISVWTSLYLFDELPQLAEAIGLEFL